MGRWFSDEKRFMINGRLNHQNIRRWAREKPDDFVNQIEAHPISVHAWCALSSKAIVGPFFFDENVNQYTYQGMIESEFIPALQETNLLDGYCYQQDGATPHCTNNSLELLKKYFGEKIISRRSEFEWPSHSPDLNPLDFFLWGVLDDKVKRRNPKTAQELRKIVCEEVKKIDVNSLPKTIEEFVKRLSLCIRADGGHFVQLNKENS